MNDSLLINGSNSLIYAICLYDTEKMKVAMFQVSNKNIIIFKKCRKYLNLIIHGQKIK